jgi:aspartate racemase
MQTLGLLGGLGPEATVIYYREIINRFRAETGKDEYPEILLHNVNMSEVLRLIAAERYNDLTELLTGKIAGLVSAGAQFCAIPSNTPHIIFERLRERATVPLISIVEATREHARASGLKKLLLIGTLFTMKNDFYRRSFSAEGIDIFVPDDEQKSIIHGIIFPELEQGVVRPEKKAEMKAISTGLIERHGLDGIILGCTELPLMLEPSDFSVAVLDTARIHIEMLVRKILYG